MPTTQIDEMEQMIYFAEPDEVMRFPIIQHLCCSASYG